MLRFAVYFFVSVINSFIVYEWFQLRKLSDNVYCRPRHNVVHLYNWNSSLVQEFP